MKSFDFSASRIIPELDLEAPGKRCGRFLLRHSGDQNPLGVYPIPAMTIIGTDGPTVLLIGGVHGDEYEGPVSLYRLFRDLTPEQVSGRLVFLPALNAPAVRAARRVSPLDGQNLNRAFPGDPDGGPTQAIAHLVEACLLPACDGVIDLHSGGHAAWFVPSVLAARTSSGALDPANIALAEAFGAPLIWVLGAHNDDRSVNGAASRVGVPAIAAELGGGGTLTPACLTLAEQGLRRCLTKLGVLHGNVEPAAVARRVEIAQANQSLTARAQGFYQPCAVAGDDVQEGECIGLIHNIDHGDAAPGSILAPCDGVLLAETRRGWVEPGDFLALVASDITD
ncbi:MAG: succinylglutamate desuccinylase/aspartoacylase family protein [Alphaproteobacteria bacterium]